MNICLVFISYGVWGGTETRVHELARHLRNKGENVSIILNQEILQDYADLENVELFNIGSLYPHKGKTKRDLFHRFLSLPYSYLDELYRNLHYRRIRKDLIQFLSDNHIDVVIAALEEAVPLVSDLADDLKSLKIAMIAMLTGEPHLRGAEPVQLLSIPFVKWRAKRFREALREMDKVIGPSAFILNAWRDQGVPLEDRSVVIHNGVDVSQIQDSLRSALKLKAESNLLFPGGARYVKGGDLVLKSLPRVKKEMPGVHVYVALDVPQDHLLRKMVRNLGLEQDVTFAGHLRVQEFRRLLNSVDMLVMPSRDEAFGIVYVEAMALGKPIIAANRGGVPEVVTNGRNGILVEPDPDQIAEAILHLYRNEDLRREISRNNTEDVAKFDWNQIADQYIEVCREVSTRIPT